MEQVPPLIFSETMRDVDLFVGVTSVGNDPRWSDGGPNGRYRNYWENFSFGDLSPSAETQRGCAASAAKVENRRPLLDHREIPGRQR
jgi:hypothetical protein